MKRKGWSEADERRAAHGRYMMRDAKKEWQKWLSQQHWDYWGTLTFCQTYSRQALRNAAVRFLEQLQKIYGMGWCFWIVEKGGINGRAHVHFVMRSARPGHPALINPDVVNDLWGKHGIAEAKAYVPALNGAAYILKSMEEGMEYDLIAPPDPAEEIVDNGSLRSIRPTPNGSGAGGGRP